MQNSHLSFGDAKASRFRAVAVCGDVCGARVFNACRSGANFRAAERSAAEPTNRQPAVPTKRASDAAKSTNGEVLQSQGTSRAAPGDTARVPAPQLERRAGHRPGNCLGRRRRGTGSGLFAPGSHSLSAGRVSLSLRQLAGSLPRDGAIPSGALSTSGRPGCVARARRHRRESRGAFFLQHHQIGRAHGELSLGVLARARLSALFPLFDEEPARTQEWRY